MKATPNPRSLWRFLDEGGLGEGDLVYFILAPALCGNGHVLYQLPQRPERPV